MNSIFMRILIPLLTLIIIQSFVSYFTIRASGAITKIEDNSVFFLTKNVENRQNMLQNMMLENRSYTYETSQHILAKAEEFFNEYNCTAEDLIKNRSLADQFSLYVSQELLLMQRTNVSTGTFFIISNGNEQNYGKSDMNFSGLYFRDLDPLTNPSNYSDIMLERGKSSISGKYKIALDSFWRESFYYEVSDDSNDNPIWDSYFNPFFVAQKRPALSTIDLGYWNIPSYLEDANNKDSNSFISYSMPVIYNGTIIGVVGCEIQLSMLTSYFPARDMGNTGGGYLLIKYNANNININGDISSEIISSTGSRIQLLRLAGKDIILKADSDYSGLFRIDGNKYIGDDLYASMKNLKLYNSYTPFGNDYWALISVDTGDTLFGGSDKINKSIILYSVIILIVASILVYVVTQFTTKPLRKVVDQIISSDYTKEPIVISRTKIFEIDELGSTINLLSLSQRRIENQLREERERYLIALESCSDTILEYTVLTDTLELFHFRDDVTPAEVYSDTFINYKQSIMNGEVCHAEDKVLLTDLFSGKIASDVEYRIIDKDSDKKKPRNYKWMSAKVKPVYDSDGFLIRIVGSLHDITERKNKELAAIEAINRDPVTDFYHREIGEKMIRDFLDSVKNKENSPYCLCVIDLNKFRMIQELHDIMFGNIVISEVAIAIREICNPDDIIIRSGGNEFIILFANANVDEVKKRVEHLCEKITHIYAGESFKLTAGCGIASGGNGDSYTELLDKALRCVRYAKMSPPVMVAEYSELVASLVNIQSQRYEPYSFSPIPKTVDYDDNNIINFALNVFEKTTDIQSAINILFVKIARKMPVRRIFLTESELDFHTSMIVNQWCAPDLKPYSHELIRSSSHCYDELRTYIGSDATLKYNTKFLRECSLGLATLFRVPENEPVSGYVCALYSSGVFSGAMFFEASDPDHVWEKSEYDTLREITKIFSTHISRSKSDLASKAKSEFLSRMSHEIRTPMNAIIGMTDIAFSCVDNAARVKEYLTKIDVSSKYLLSLINDVLDMSRIESGKMKIVIDSMNISDIIDSVDIIIRQQAENKAINFVVDKNIRDTYIFGDGFRLNQVLINLLGNAVKFTNNGGNVTFSAVQFMHDTKYATIRFSVKDDGIGISKEDAPRIFKAFEQATENTVTKFGGTGLGLAISSSIVSLMGGRIELESELNAGSEFYFTLQFEIDKNHKAADESNLLEEKDYSGYFKGKKALIVEDNDLNIEIAQNILEFAGFETELAENGKLAVEKYVSAPQKYYDVILMDIRMPVMNGLEATVTIRNVQTHSDSMTIPIVAMTANAFDEDMKKSIEAGMNGHIAKPIDINKLYTLLDKLIK